MMGIIVELFISWLLLWFFDKSNLSALGIRPTKKRISWFIIGFLIASAFCAIYYLSVIFIAGNKLSVYSGYGVEQFFKGAGWTLTSVLYEELIFRGALLYIAIRKLGIRTACVISAIAFGIYHWFTFGSFGDPGQMLIIFVMTGTWGLMFAFSFAKTGSLYLPVGIHLGWNLVNNVVFSKGPLGPQLLAINGENRLDGIASLLFFIMQIIALPLLTYFLLYGKRQSPGKEQTE